MAPIVLIAGLVGIVVQDFTSRAIRFWWILYPLALIAAAYMAYVGLGEDRWTASILMNLLFVFIQLSVLSVYFMLTRRKVFLIFDTFLGWGDVLLFVVLCFLFSPINFMVFYIGSVLFSLILAISWLAKIDRRIPLAGLQGSMYLFVLVLDYSLPNFSCFDDNWIYSFI